MSAQHMPGTRPGVRRGKRAQGRGRLLSAFTSSQPSGGARHRWIITVPGDQSGRTGMMEAGEAQQEGVRSEKGSRASDG